MQPLRNRVLILPIEEPKEQKTKSGLYLAEQYETKPYSVGKVVASGDGEYQNGKLIENEVENGDVVYFNSFNAINFDIDGVNHKLVYMDEILGVK